MTNPFTVFSPEGLAAEEVVELFVENSPGADSIQSAGHSMLVGPRGAGKSMMLRYMEPDCQRLVHANGGEPSKLCDLPYYAAYVTVRETELSIPSIGLIEKSHSNIPLNEHLLVLTISLSMLGRAHRNGHYDEQIKIGAVSSRLNEIKSMHAVVPTDEIYPEDTEEVVLEKMTKWLTAEHEYAMDYFGRLLINGASVSFDRKLFRFAGFLSPMVAVLKDFPSMPSTGSFYLCVDDADRLTETQTKILNSWLARRNSEFNLKVSYEMFGYKTFYTTSDTRIEAPHDYQELRISDVYTSNKKTNYRDRMRSMINRRLMRADITRTKFKIPDVDDFFPEDHHQKIQIDRIKQQKKREIESQGTGRSSRTRDDLYRYVLPDYISSLGGGKRSRSTYKYSGFDQLVDISSGVPRYFLEAAQKMYDRQVVRSGTKAAIREISAEVQDSVVRDLASELYMDELEKLKMDPKSSAAPDVALRLNNLVGSLGALFEKIMNDPHASERRVFSFALSDYPDTQVEEVLRLGLKYAFLSRSSIGRKEGFGRTEKYVLSRRFAPYWNLDPSGFSAYKFLTNAEIKLMMESPNQYRLQLRRENVRYDELQLEMPLTDEGSE
jgi:hypothetical protein